MARSDREFWSSSKLHDDNMDYDEQIDLDRWTKVQVGEHCARLGDSNLAPSSYLPCQVIVREGSTYGEPGVQLWEEFVEGQVLGIILRGMHDVGIGDEIMDSDFFNQQFVWNIELKCPLHLSLGLTNLRKVEPRGLGMASPCVPITYHPIPKALHQWRQVQWVGHDGPIQLGARCEACGYSLGSNGCPLSGEEDQFKVHTYE
ncbi:hypothetical protein FPOAC1_003469 [Fusarium poae]|uniref:hypothetical protein n=1 Tax=Fusarium poae TaxID=36050 RepID=UPI001CE91616|nr:hypothetical protein FPOAC1_003469 [Fusarium poae]KAG8677451.1 hypothetical protein FPOAC1_003469 [Fusarium poae]